MFGKKVDQFCQGLDFAVLRAFETENEVEDKESKPISPVKQKKKARFRRQARSRFRGQTQTQFYNFGNGNGSAEAVAKPDASTVFVRKLDSIFFYCVGTYIVFISVAFVAKISHHLSHLN